jgi:anti-sigma regulatory factor (Ser/Thr protein kinase)
VTPSRTFPAAPDSVAEARRFVDEVLVETSLDSLQRAELIVSELAANCVEHAGTAFTVGLAVDHRTVRGEVTDTGGGLPTPRIRDPRRLRGRGLLIVESLSDEWGTMRTAAAGKTVWFVLAGGVS